MPTRVRRSSRSSTSCGALVGHAEDQLGQRDRHAVARPARSSSASASPVTVAGGGEHEARRRCRSGGPARARRASSRASGRGARRRAAAARASGRARRRARRRDGGVDGVLGHPPVGRQLAAHDRDDAGAARSARRGGGRGRRSRRRPSRAGAAARRTPRPRRRGPAAGPRRGRATSSRKSISASVGSGTSGTGAVDRLVGEADVDRAVGLGERHHEPAGAARDRRGDATPQPGQRLGAEHQVGAAAGPQPHLVDQVAGPDAGGVDHRAGRDLGRLAGQLVAQHGAVAGRADARGRGCARRRRGRPRCGRSWRPAGRRPRAGRPRRAARRGRRRREAGRERQGLGGGDPPRAGAGSGARCGPRRAARRRRRCRPAGGRPAGGSMVSASGSSIGSGVGQVGGGDLHQDAALDGALVGDADLAVGEVAQAAVHQLGRPARRTEREVVGVDRQHGQAARRPRRGRRRRR